MQSAKDYQPKLLKRQAITWLLNNFKGIYISLECANKLIERGAEEHPMMRLFLRNSDKYTIFMFLPAANVVLAANASTFHDTDDDTALTVSLIPTLEAREAYLNGT